MIKAGVHDACLVFLMRRFFLSVWSLLLFFSFLASFCLGQPSGTTAGSDPAQEAQRALNLAKAGQCSESLSRLRKAAARATQTQKDVKPQAGFACVRCAMVEGNADT